jgi:hypothetical protein
MQWEVKSIVETEDSVEATIQGSYDSLKEVERVMMVTSDMVQEGATLTGWPRRLKRL